MKVSILEVQVTSPEGVPFHEVTDPSTGEIYVVAQAGKQFELRYKIDPQSFSSLKSDRVYRIGARVDGKDIGCGNILKVHNQTKQIGFVRQGDAFGVSYDQFKFGAASSASADEVVEAESLEFSQGKIEITLQERREMPGEDNYVTKVSYYQASRVPYASLPADKKFFLAPSLTTESAGVKFDAAGVTTKTYVDVGPPAVKFTFRYETPTTLFLRNILSRGNPAHAVILDSFLETRRVPATAAQPSGSTAPTRHQQHRINKEKDASSNDFVDLVGNQVVSSSVAENLKPNEELVCDLTADEAAPRWKKRQK